MSGLVPAMQAALCYSEPLAWTERRGSSSVRVSTDDFEQTERRLTFTAADKNTNVINSAPLMVSARSTPFRIPLKQLLVEDMIGSSIQKWVTAQSNGHDI